MADKVIGYELIYSYQRSLVFILCGNLFGDSNIISGRISTETGRIRQQIVINNQRSDGVCAELSCLPKSLFVALDCLIVFAHFLIDHGNVH
ncbi:hypothetical protein D9M72_478050 [compost metagenome]